MTQTLDTDTRYRVRGWDGLAFRVRGWVQVPELDTYYVTDDAGEEWEVEEATGEWVDDPSSGMVRVVAVGDDHEHVADLSDLSPIADDDYCAGCGQIGCGW